MTRCSLRAYEHKQNYSCIGEYCIFSLGAFYVYVDNKFNEYFADEM